MKRRFITGFLSTILATSLYANNIKNEDCVSKGENFIYSGNECIEYKKFEGDDNGKLIIIVHGSWDEGTNILARYAPFAENVYMQTDVTTIAVALPGYSGSSTNNFPALLNSKEIKYLSSNEGYLTFVSELIKDLKDKYEANNITYLGHSAGCAIGATMLGFKPDLIDNLVCAGGSFDISKKTNEKGLISAVDVINNIPKDAKIALVYGTADDVSKPEVTIDFYNLMKDKGFNVKLVEAPNAPHIDLDMTNASVDALISLIEEE